MRVRRILFRMERFATASSASDRERDIRGMTIAVRGVAGPNLTEGSEEQHFVLNSHPVMMVGTTREFLELLRANDAGGVARVLYFLRHLRAVNIAREAQQQPSSHLDIPYWSAVPYRFGGARTAVKYAVHPTSTRRSERPRALTDDYLRAALRAHLMTADASFDFSVQCQSDAVRTPIEDASVEWKTTVSPFRRVARIVVPRQTLDDAEEAACEAAAFSPWHSLPEHQPIGGMNRARREIYRQMAAFRAARAMGD